MTEIDTMSLFKQLNRGHTAQLQNHSIDRLTELSNDLFDFMYAYDMHRFKSDRFYGESFTDFKQRITARIKTYLQDCPNYLIDILLDMADSGSCDSGNALKINDLIRRIKKTV